MLTVVRDARRDEESKGKRILVVGVPRSGTTWVATLLGSTKDSIYLEEPDNHLTYPFASRAKRTLPGCFYTALRPGASAAEYETLWREAFRMSDTRTSGRSRLRRFAAAAVWRSVDNAEIRRAFQDPDAIALKLRAAEALAVPERPAPGPGNVVVKSVYAALSVEWIAERFPVRVVVVHRDLLNVLSSWVELQWIGTPGDDMLDGLDPRVRQMLTSEHGIPMPEDGASPLARGVWLLVTLDLSLEAAARRHPDWIVVRHEELCVDPGAAFRSLARELGLEWTTESDHKLAALNQPGRGTETVRVASELPEIWRSRLRPDQVDEIGALVESFRNRA